ncbi:hypothetical protein Tco_0226304 [Tanacetum coccineum]
MTIYRNNQPNNFSVDSDFTLKKVGFSEWLELKDLAAKKIRPEGLAEVILASDPRPVDDIVSAGALDTFKSEPLSRKSKIT